MFYWLVPGNVPWKSCDLAIHRFAENRLGSISPSRYHNGSHYRYRLGGRSRGAEKPVTSVGGFLARQLMPAISALPTTLAVALALPPRRLVRFAFVGTGLKRLKVALRI